MDSHLPGFLPTSHQIKRTIACLWLMVASHGCGTNCTQGRTEEERGGEEEVPVRLGRGTPANEQSACLRALDFLRQLRSIRLSRV